MARSRVLHVIDSLGPGGAQSVLENLLRYGDRERFEYHAATLHGEGVYAARLRVLDVPVHSFARRKTDPFLPVRMASAIRALRPDIIHTHLVVSCALGEWLRFFRPGHVVQVSHLHFMVAATPDYPYQNILERIIYRASDAVVACSRAVARSYKPHHGEARLHVVQNGIDDKRLTGCDAARREATRRGLGIAGEAPVLISAARLASVKNLAYGIQVFAELRRVRPDAVYLIAGEGAEEAALRALAKELNLGESVRFLGYRNDVPDLLAGSDLYMMPSLNEGLPMVLVEAMGVGCLPVVTPFEAGRELVRDGWNGARIPFDDAAVAAARVAQLLEADRRQMAARCVAFARRRFSASQMTRQVESIYAELLRGGKS